MVGPLLTLAAAWAGDCTIAADLDRAADAILSLDLPAGEQALEAAKAGLACGAVPSGEIARYWLLAAAHAEFDGAPTRVEPALLAGRTADPTVWVDALGPDLRSRWESVRPPEGTASLQLTDLPAGYVATLDGRPFDGSFAPGFHVIQAIGGDQGFGRVIRASAGDTIQLATELPPLPEPEPMVVEPTVEPETVPRPGPPQQRVVTLHLALGLNSVFGESFATEPPTKVGPALEVGVLVEPVESVWIRAAVAGELAVAGNWAYADGQDTRGLAVSPSAFLAAGVRTGELRLGVLTGLQLPGRLPLRALGHFAFTDAVGVEVRAGANLRRLVSGDTTIEPALSTHLTVRL